MFPSLAISALQITFQFVMLWDETTKDDRPQKRMKQKNPKPRKRKLKQDMNSAKKRRKLTMKDHFEIRVSSLISVRYRYALFGFSVSILPQIRFQIGTGDAWCLSDLVFIAHCHSPPMVSVSNSAPTWCPLLQSVWRLLETHINSKQTISYSWETLGSKK